MTIGQLSSKSSKKKSAAQRLWFLHWLMAGFYLLLFVTGYFMADWKRGIWYRQPVYDFHKTLGAVVMSLLLARIFVLLLVTQHKYRRHRSKRNWFSNVALHTGLYFLMLLVPLSGYIASNAHGYNVVVFGTGIALPSLVSVNKQLGNFSSSAHFWLAYTFLAFIVLHAGVQHKYLRAQARRFFKAARRVIAGAFY